MMTNKAVYLIDNYKEFLAIFLPLIGGLIPSSLFLRKISQRRIISIAHGLFAYIILIIGTFLGMLLSGYLHPEIYIGFGDNPSVMTGWMSGLQIGSLVLIYAWFRYRLISKKSFSEILIKSIG